MIIDSLGRKWFKGNLHTHTTVSDGQKSPRDTVDLYRASGYDFMAITDHWHLSKTEFDGDMLLISGCEYNFGETASPDDGIYHILTLGAARDPEVTRSMTPQQALDAIKAAGGMTVLAHPAWSLNRPDKVEQLTNIDAVEIFNSVSDLPRSYRPDSGAFVDMLAAGGVILPLIAVDDTHFYLGEECRSYIMVNADDLTEKSIMTAIRDGNYYSTQGPSISLSVGADKITAVTSEAEKIIFISDSVWVGERNFIAPKGETITIAAYRIPPTDTFVRVEAIDKNGRTAWSNIVKVR